MSGPGDDENGRFPEWTTPAQERPNMETGTPKDMPTSDRGAAYWLRRIGGGTWPAIREALGYNTNQATGQAAKLYAKAHGLRWPL